MEKCRENDMKVIHAPSPPVAKRHDNWVQLVKPEEVVKKKDEWPPKDFRTIERSI